MVSSSTRRFPSTAIESTVCACAGAETATAAKVAAAGAANMTKAANSPPLTRIPNIMRNAPLSLAMPDRSPTTRQIPNLPLSL
ncbi:hypothetical protein BraRD5C2_10490 [Bradyrhizobium sp. RD5-C2]|nr:hypothetical protein BraRD5C2_10490 [Bradyrhizobium sp. RD5-C2]